MIGRLQFHAPGVTKLTTVRRIDLGMADQAIRHARQGGFAHDIRLFQSAMACRTGIPAIEVRANVSGRRQVSLGIDGAGQQRRDIAQPQMLRVTEARHGGHGRRRNRDLFVTAQAHFLFRQEIVGGICARGRGRVTPGALEFHLQVQPVRKGTRTLSPEKTHGRHRHADRAQHYPL